jgi:tetratricopeptide (TPR) repeat protein
MRFVATKTAKQLDLQAFRLYPDRFEVKLDIKARAFMKKGEFDRAIADLSQSIHLKPDNYGTWFNRGEIHFKKGEYERAIADFTGVIRLKPRHVGAYTGRGEAHAQKTSDIPVRALLGAARLDRLTMASHEASIVAAPRQMFRRSNFGRVGSRARRVRINSGKGEEM